MAAHDEATAVSRRAVLRGLLGTGATVVVAGTGLLSYRVYDQAVLDPDRGAAFDPWRQWQETDGPLGLVAAAILAANPHNSQPWAFGVTESTIEVYADRERTTGSLDSRGRELHVGLGCALENLVLAARARGWEPAVSLLPDGSAADLVARVQLTPSAPRPSELYDAIPTRHTQRGAYQQRSPSSGELAALVDTSELSGVGLHWITSETDRSALGQLMVEAAVAITEDDEQSRDSFVWIRSSNDDIQRYRDGLTLDVQAMSPLLLTAAKLLPASTRATGDKFWVDSTREVHTATAAAYGVITTADPQDVAAQLVGGRLLERIHLTATARGIALHHMNQITERIDREAVLGTEPTFAPRFAALLPDGGRPLASFRVGYAGGDARLSPRRPVSEVLL